jgi:hypothetical protein
MGKPSNAGHPFTRQHQGIILSACMIKGLAVPGVIAIVSGLALLTAPVHAAVRACGGFIDSAGGPTEIEARTKALDGWMNAVEALGTGPVLWEIAAERSLECDRAGGVYRCRARARPCVIKQVAPKGWTPAKRRDVFKDPPH